VHPFRIAPKLDPQAFKTYQVVAPLPTHFRSASCQEARCSNYLSGWRTVIDEISDLGKRQAHYIRKQSGRAFTEYKDEAGMTAFTFEAGQRCFAQHQVRTDTPEIYLVKGGDWRGNPMGVRPRRHASADDWVEDFAEHQQRLADEISKG
jgi:hypothetical protein